MITLPATVDPTIVRCPMCMVREGRRCNTSAPVSGNGGTHEERRKRAWELAYREARDERSRRQPYVRFFG